MKNMVTAFLHLRDIEPGHVAIDTGTIEQRLAELLPFIERDIFECANACDTYSKKTHLVRVVQCTAWNEIMQRWVGRFSRYKSMVLDAVKVHTGVIDNVDSGVLDQLMSKCVWDADSLRCWRLSQLGCSFSGQISYWLS